MTSMKLDIYVNVRLEIMSFMFKTLARRNSLLIMNKRKRLIYFVISGLIVIPLSIIFWGLSGMGESDNDYNYIFLLPLIVWSLGFALQLKRITRAWGIIVALIPATLYLILIARFYFW